MRAIRARYNPYLQAKHRIEQVHMWDGSFHYTSYNNTCGFHDESIVVKGLFEAQKYIYVCTVHLCCRQILVNMSCYAIHNNVAETARPFC